MNDPRKDPRLRKLYSDFCLQQAKNDQLLLTDLFPGLRAKAVQKARQRATLTQDTPSHPSSAPSKADETSTR